MNINIIRLNANKRESDLVKKLNEKLSFNHINLKENVSSSPFTLFFIESGGVEEQFRQLMIKYTPPYYIVSINENNALAASMEIASYLNNKNYKHTIYANEDTLVNDIINLCCAYHAKNKMKGLKLGVIGEPSSWLIASKINYSLVKEKFDIDILDIDINELYRFIEKPHHIEYPNCYPSLSNKNPFDDRLLFESMLVYNGLKRIINKYHLSGLTIRCFDLIKKYKISACLALGILNDEGIISSCEGDVVSLLTMLLVRCITSKESFMVNLSKLNYKEKTAVFAHCTIPLKMCKNYSLDHHYETNESLAIKGELYQGVISIIKLSNDLKDIRIEEGYILSNLNEPCFCKTQIKVKLNVDFDEFIDSKFANHSVLIYGKYDKLFKKFSSLFLSNNL